MEILNKILDLKTLDYKIKNLKSQNKTIVFCTGCYDILQPGHVIFFNQCRQFGDVLIVGVGRDSTIKELKGENRPVNPENNRIFLIASLENVDYTVLNDKDILPGKIDFAEILKIIKPNVFVLNNDDLGIKEKSELCEKLNIQLKLVSRTVPPYLKPTSSTEILKIRNSSLKCLTNQ